MRILIFVIYAGDAAELDGHRGDWIETDEG